MAKETFDRSKPHVNIGASTKVFQDTSGELKVEGTWSEDVGNPDSSTILTLTAPPQSARQTFIVGYPFDDEFSYDPAVFGPALSFDFNVDVLAISLQATSDLEVTLAILQDQPFLATSAGGTADSQGGWKSIRGGGLRLHDFHAIDDPTGVLDLSRPFEFGFAFSGEFSSEGLLAEVAVDNMTVEITPVPEPTTIALVLAMGVALVWNRLWRSADEDTENSIG